MNKQVVTQHQRSKAQTNSFAQNNSHRGLLSDTKTLLLQQKKSTESFYRPDQQLQGADIQKTSIIPLDIIGQVPHCKHRLPGRSFQQQLQQHQHVLQQQIQQTAAIRIMEVAGITAPQSGLPRFSQFNDRQLQPQHSHGQLSQNYQVLRAAPEQPTNLTTVGGAIKNQRRLVKSQTQNSLSKAPLFLDLKNQNQQSFENYIYSDNSKQDSVVTKMIDSNRKNETNPIQKSLGGGGVVENLNNNLGKNTDTPNSPQQRIMLTTVNQNLQKPHEDFQLVDFSSTQPSDRLEKIYQNLTHSANKVANLKGISASYQRNQIRIPLEHSDSYQLSAGNRGLNHTTNVYSGPYDDGFLQVSSKEKSPRLRPTVQTIMTSRNQGMGNFNGQRTEPSSHQFIALGQTEQQDSILQVNKMQQKHAQEFLAIFQSDIDRLSGRSDVQSYLTNRHKQIRPIPTSESDQLSMQLEGTLQGFSLKRSKSIQNEALQIKERIMALKMLKKQGSLENPTSIQEEEDIYDLNAENQDIKQGPKEQKKDRNKAISVFKKNPDAISVQRKSIPSLMNQQAKDRQQKNDKEIALALKITLYLDFSRVINFSNDMTIQQPPQQTGQKIYKAFVTKGNNGVLIRAALKNRWWWSLSEVKDDYDSINFLWTQWRKPNFFKLIKSIDDLSLPLEQQPAALTNEPQQDQALETTRTESNDEQTSQQLQLTQDQTDETVVLSPDSTGVSTKAKTIISSTVPPLNKKLQGNLNNPAISSMFTKVAPLLNVNDVDLLKKYACSQKASNKGYFVPPVFSKETYENGIETEYSTIRNNQLSGSQQRSSKGIRVFKSTLKQKMHNHMEYNFHLANKKALYYNMKSYYTLMDEDVFSYLPVTFHIQNGLDDPEFANFISYYHRFEAENPKRKNVWIIKPGESSNRGNGIQVAGDIASVRDIIKNRESHQNGFKKTYIIQKYLDKPFLYNKRKFDIRCFMLMTNYNNKLKVYWYQEGYIRTSTKEFTLKNLENRMIHLTNEAVQKRGDDFGKFENGNKLSYSEFQKYIDATHPKDNLNFMQTIYPAMKKLAYDSVCSVYTKIDKKKRNFSFELFGLDFMIDDSFKTWLIEINTNPSLTIAAPLMSRLLPGLIDNVLKVAIDPIFPPPSFPKAKKHMIPEQIYENNKFDLLFDADIDGARIDTLYQNVSLKIDDQLEEDCKNEEVYDDDDVDQEEDYED